MARCFLYNRTIDAVVINQQFYGKPRTSSDDILLKIKGEPPDTYNDDSEANVSRVVTEVYSKGNQNIPSDETLVKLNRSLHNKENVFAIGTSQTEENDETNQFKEKILTRKRKQTAVESGTPRKRSKRETTGTCEIAPRKDKRRRIERKKRSIENPDKNSAASSTLCRIQNDAMNAQDSNDALFECDICSVAFETSEILENHKAMYTDVPPKYECSLCPTGYKFRSLLTEHTGCIHANNPRSGFNRIKYICNFCQKKFRSKLLLQAHVFHSNHQISTSNEFSLKESREESSVLAASESTLSISSADAASDKASEKLNHQEKGSFSTPSKKMRQMVMTDFFATSPSSIKTEPISPAKIRNVRKSSSSSPEPTIVYTTALVHRSATPDQDRNVPSTSTACSTPQRLIRSRSRMSSNRVIDFNNTGKTRSNVSAMKVKTKAVDDDSQIMIDGASPVPRSTSTLNKNSSVGDKTSAIQQTAARTNSREDIDTQERIASKKSRVRHRSKKWTDDMLRRFYKCQELTIPLKRCDEKAINVSVTSDLTVSDITVHSKNASNVIEPSINASNGTESNVNATNVTDCDTDAPDVSVPNISAPDIIQPIINASDITQPNICAPDITESNINVSHLIQSNINASVITEPNRDAPNVAVPNVRTPDISQTVRTQCDMTQPDTTQSNIHTSDIAQPNINASGITRSNVNSPDITEPNISIPVKTVPYVTASVITARSMDGSDNIVNPSPLAQPQPTSPKTSNNIKQQDVLLKKVEVCIERLSPNKLRECVEKRKSPGTEEKSENIYKCEICDMEFSKRRERREHVKQAHTAYMSVLCKSRSDKKPKLVTHYLQRHSTSVRTECCVCQQVFPTRHAMKRHLLVHCIKITTSQKGALLSYSEMRCDGSVKKYKCTACCKVFKMYSSLKQHREICTLWKKMAENSGFSQITTPTKVGVVRERRRKESVATSVDDSSRTGTELNSEKAANEASAENKVAGKKKTSPNLNPLPNSTRVDGDLLPTSPSNLLVDTVSTNIEIPKDTGMRNNVNQNVRYPCDLCRLQFRTMKNLWMHKRAYWASLKEPCSICNTSFPSRSFLSKHMINTHMGQVNTDYRFHCRYCGQSFGKKETVRMHEAHFHYREQNSSAANDVTSDQNDTWNFSTMCTTCHIIFADYDRLREHNTYYYGGHVFPCTFCDQRFQGMYLLHHHHKMVHYPEAVQKSYEFRCDICNEGFKTESHYFAHKAHVHWIQALSLVNELNARKSEKADRHGVSVPRCPTCQLGFVSSEELALHDAEFSNQGSFACDKCDRQCHTSQALVAHRSLTHDDTVETCYRCPICKEGHSTRVKLLCHERHFHQNRMVQTMSLEKHSQQLFEEINAHSLQHSVPEQQASTAAQSVRTDESVRKPTISVKKIEELTGSAPLNKDHCNSSELQNVGLSIEGDGEQKVGTSTAKTPTKIKPIQCTVCNASFSSMRSYKRHNEQYVTTGTFQCEYCPRRFRCLSVRREHSSKHFCKTQSQYVCLICNEGFQNAELMSRHILHLHPAVNTQTDQDNVQNSGVQDKSQSTDLTQEKICDITFVATESGDLLNLSQEVLDDGTAQTARDPLIIDEQNNHNYTDYNATNHSAIGNGASDHMVTNCKSTDPRFTALKTVNLRTDTTKPSKHGSTNHKTVNQKIADEKPAEQKTIDQKVTEQKVVAQKAAAQKAADQKAAIRKATDRKAADVKAAGQKVADQEAAIQKTSDLKAADQKKADDQKAAIQKTTDQKVTDQKVVAQKAAIRKATDRKTADVKSADVKAADQEAAFQKTSDLKAADQKKADDQKAAIQKTTDQKVTEQKKADDQKAAIQKVTEQKVVAQKTADQKAAIRKDTDRKAPDVKAAGQKVADQEAAIQKTSDLKAADQKKADDQKAAIQKTTDQKVADQKTVDAKAAEQNAAIQKTTDQMVAAQKTAAQKAADQIAVIQKVTQQKAAEQKTAEQNTADEEATGQKAAEKEAVLQKTIDQKVANQKADIRKIIDEKVADLENAAIQDTTDQKVVNQKADDRKAAVQQTTDQNVADQNVAAQNVAAQKVVAQKVVAQMVVDQKAAIKKTTGQGVDQKATDQKTVIQKTADQKTVDHRTATSKAIKYKNTDHIIVNQNTAGPKTTNPKITDPKTTNPKITDPKTTIPKITDQTSTNLETTTNQRVVDQRTFGHKTTDCKITNPKTTDDRATDQPKDIPLICLGDSDNEDREVSTSIARNLLNEGTSLEEKYVIPESAELLQLACIYCPAKYQNDTELQTHLAVQHRGSNRQIVPWDGTSLPLQSIPCVLCNSRFSTQPAFKKHLLTVHLPCIRIVSNDPMKSSSARVIYRLHKTSGPISYVPIANGASSSSTSSQIITPVASGEKVAIINPNNGTRTARLKVRTIVDIAASIPNDKKPPSSVAKNKIIRLIKIKNSNNTCVSGKDLKVTNSVNVTPQN